jgi:hypothetical protein
MELAKWLVTPLGQWTIGDDTRHIYCKSSPHSNGCFIGIKSSMSHGRVNKASKRVDAFYNQPTAATSSHAVLC